MQNEEDNVGVKAAKVKGIYDSKTYLDKQTLLDKNCIVTDSFDGAEYKKIKNKKTGIFLFNSQILNSTTIKVIHKPRYVKRSTFILRCYILF